MLLRPRNMNRRSELLLSAAALLQPPSSENCSITIIWMISPPSERKECMPLLAALVQVPYSLHGLNFSYASNSGGGTQNCSYSAPIPDLFRPSVFTPYSEPLATDLANYSPWLLDSLIQENSWSHYGPSLSMTLGESDTILLQTSCNGYTGIRAYVRPGPPTLAPSPPAPPRLKKPRLPPPEPLATVSPPPLLIHSSPNDPSISPPPPPPSPPPPSPPPPTSPINSMTSYGLSNSDASSLLDFHNLIRSNYPGVQPLVWSNKLSTTASRLNRLCNYSHMSKSLYLGENLALGWMDPLSLGQLWYTTEACTYNYSEPGLFQAGHFTQMVWRRVTSMGCSFIGPRDCPEIYFDEKKVYWRGASMLRCLYDPPGNFQGSLNYIQNVLPPLSPPSLIPPGCKQAPSSINAP